MTLLKQILGWSVAVGLVIMCLGTLWAIIRFSFISGRRTRGEKQRLQVPDAAGVERLAGIPIPIELIEFYRKSDVIGRTEFHFVDLSQTPPKGWFIGGFVPLTPIDTKEHRMISKIPGVPIATDLDGG